MTLQQREPFEDLAKGEKAKRTHIPKKKPVKLCEIEEREYAENARTIKELVTQSFRDNSKC